MKNNYRISHSRCGAHLRMDPFRPARSVRPLALITAAQIETAFLSIFRKQLAHACLCKLVACKPRKSPMFETNSLDPMRLGRLNAALDKQYRFNGRVRSLRDHILELAKDGPLDLSESDGMID